MAAELIRMERIEKFYGSVHALDEVTLAVHENEIVGLLGDNGAGKATLIKILSGAVPMSAGTILKRGQPVRSPYMLTVDENLRHGHSAIGALQHFRALGATHRDVIFLERDALAVQQFLCPMAISAKRLGIDFDLFHIGCMSSSGDIVRRCAFVNCRVRRSVPWPSTADAPHGRPPP